MRLFAKTLIILAVTAYLLIAAACGPTQAPKTTPAETAPEPSIEDLRKPVAQDPTIYKAAEVLQKYGRFTKKYMSYDKYQKATGGQPAAMDPDWFYDSYVLDMNEKGYWATITFGTSKRAVARDPRIQKLMADLPSKSIFMKLKTPKGNTYLLSDAEADGVLDFVKNVKDKDIKKVDIKLLDTMQEKYTWIIGIVKKHYKKK